MLELTEKEKSELVAQYEPLINRLVSQFYKEVKCPWNDLKSMAYEGFAIAIKKYDKTKSSQTFTQFVAYAIRHCILSSLDEELRTVKLSSYAQKKIINDGGTLFNTVSIDNLHSGPSDDGTHKHVNEYVMGLYEDEKFSNGDVLEYLYNRLENEKTLSDIDREIFYRTFGLHGYDEMQGTSIAKLLNLSEGRVSQRLHDVLNFIRHDKELCEMLASLQEGMFVS